MKNLRRWQLSASEPYTPQLAADARLSATDYTDDQVWQFMLGTGESPVLALQTRYGGRVGLASLVPMWLHEGRIIYQTVAYAEPPVISAFAPGYLQAQARLTPQLNLLAEYWAMDSHTIGGRYTLRNNNTSPVTLRFDLFGHVAAEGKELSLSILTLHEGHNALALGAVANLRPVVIVENGTASGAPPSPKVGVDLTISAKGQVAIRWAHAGLTDVRDSLALAQYWLGQDWADHLKRIAQAAQAIPMIETGNKRWDATIAFSYQQLVQSYLKPTASLPYGSFVATRQPAHGFSPRGDGSDHNRHWSGQEPTLAYLLALAMASIDGQMSQGIIRNYLAVQRDDGWIDRKPGLAGQRQELLCTPLLARLAWSIFQYTQDAVFLKDVFPRLVKFFERWLQSDGDGDGFPEWQNERQIGFPYLPTFAALLPWGQGADISLLETPDLLVYLLSEADSLRQMATQLGNKTAAARLDQQRTALHTHVESLWRNGRYVYRDRDTHATTGSVVILDSVRGDEEHLPALELTPPNRVIVYVAGGLDHVPLMTLHLEGLDRDGQPVKESVPAEQFDWHRGRGVFTSRSVFSQLDRVRLEGLTGVYRVTVKTVDTTRLDINALLPLTVASLPKERADSLVRLLTDSAHFWRPNGVTMCSAQDSAFDPANAQGCGGVWPFWVTLIGEGLLQHGYAKEATELVHRLLELQTRILSEQKAFSEFYDSDQPHGLGEKGHVGGIIPLHLLLRTLGVRIVSRGKVWAGGPFTWGKAVTVKQHGVTVERSRKGTRICFPSGHEVRIQGDAWQEVTDPNPVSTPPLEPSIPAPVPEKSKSSPATTVRIQVEHEEDEHG